MTAHRSDRPIHLVALRAQYDELKPRIDAAIASVIARSAFIAGPEVADFERWFGAHCGVRHALGVSSGTSAIELTLRALGIGEGDDVIVPAHTFIATGSAIAAAGAKPVVVDVDERTGSLDASRLRSAVTARTKAIMPVHLYGRPAAMREILAAAGDVPVVEDAAQSHGATYDGRRTGSIGVAGCFSFYPTKNLGAFGDAGLVTTNDDRIAAQIRLLRDHGRISKYEHAVVGQTARLDNLQAAVLRVQADALDGWNARRRQAAAWYRELLPADLDFARDEPGRESVYHLFVVRVRDRDEFRAHLEARGIATAVHYPIPLHLQPAFRSLGYAAGDFPVAERLAREVVSLPMHPFLTRDDVEHVARAAAEFLSARPAASGAAASKSGARA
jgi:dTDP-3-amino-3,4,6-trideoxy-alpha-D-glucose transaminase